MSIILGHREQFVAVGQSEINAMLAEGWHLDKIRLHSESRAVWYNTSRGTDLVEFWVVGVLSRFVADTEAESGS